MGFSQQRETLALPHALSSFPSLPSLDPYAGWLKMLSHTVAELVQYPSC